MTTAQLFAEALATIPALIRAGAVWLVLLCGAAGLAVYAVCVTVWALPCGAWRAVDAGLAATAARRTLDGPRGGTETSGCSPVLPDAPEACDARTGPRTPSWARDDTDNRTEIEEAA